MSRPASARPNSTLSTTLMRGMAFFALWLVLMQSTKPADLAVGAFATLGATWLSLRLLAPAAGHLRFGSLLAYLPHFLLASVQAGIDVARRAFDPRLPLRAGFVDYAPAFRPGLARNTLATLSSLMPGTLPADASDDALVYHCLDTSQPVVEALRDEERRLAGAIIEGQAHD